MADIHSVRMFIGANAYAVIRHGDSCQTDIRLSPGKSAQESLREYARELQAEIVRKQSLAELARAAADHLDYEKAGVRKSLDELQAEHEASLKVES